LKNSILKFKPLFFVRTDSIFYNFKNFTATNNVKKYYNTAKFFYSPPEIRNQQTYNTLFLMHIFTKTQLV